MRLVPKKILIMDDDDEYRDYLSFGLKNAGYETLGAADGKQGLQTVKTFLPDVVILDLNMPTMNGFEVCEQIRADKAFATLKIVVLSAKRYLSDIHKAKNLGADYYLVKPFTFEKLLEMVQSL